MKSESGFCCMVVPARASLGILRHRPLIFNNSDNCFVFFSFGKILVATGRVVSGIFALESSGLAATVGTTVRWETDGGILNSCRPPERSVVDPKVLASSAGGGR